MELTHVDFSWITGSVINNLPSPNLTFVFLGDHGKTLLCYTLPKVIDGLHLEDLLENFKPNLEKLLEDIRTSFKVKLEKISSIGDLLEFVCTENPVVLGKTKYLVNGKRISLEIDLKNFLKDKDSIRVIENAVYTKVFGKKPPIRFSGELWEDIQRINNDNFEKALVKVLKEKLYNDLITFLESIKDKSKYVEIFTIYPRISKNIEYPVPFQIITVPYELLLEKQYIDDVIKICKTYKNIFVFLPPEILYPMKKEDFKKIVDIVLDPNVKIMIKSINEKMREKVSLLRNIMDVLFKSKNSNVVFVIPRYDEKTIDENILPAIAYRFHTKLLVDEVAGEKDTIEQTIKNLFGDKYWDRSLFERIPKTGDLLEDTVTYIEYFIVNKIIENLNLKKASIIKVSSLKKETHYQLFKEMLKIIAENNRLWSIFSRYLRSHLLEE